MTQPSEQDLQNAAMALYVHAAQMIKAGKSRDAILNDLVRQGVSMDTAKVILERLNQSRDNVTRRYGYRNAFIGVILIVLMTVSLLGIGIDRATGASYAVGLLVLACGVLALGRGLLQIYGKPLSNSGRKRKE